MERESHWQYMKRKMREEQDKQGICQYDESVDSYE
jgi:hypothetical protein